jgi:hypothetical protein
MNKGAGTGPGLKGPGSQNAGGTSTGDAAPGSGSATGSPKKNVGVTMAQSMDKTPFILTGLVMVLTLTGTMLL